MGRPPEVKWDPQKAVLLIDGAPYESGDGNDVVDVPVAVLRTLPIQAVPRGLTLHVVRRVLGDSEYMPDGAEVVHNERGLVIRIGSADGLSEEDTRDHAEQLADLGARRERTQRAIAAAEGQGIIANGTVSEIHDDELFYYSFEFRLPDPPPATVLAFIEQAQAFDLDAALRPTTKLRCFVSYSRQDKKTREDIQRFLQPLARQHHVELWADVRIRAGAKWKAEIFEQIDEADVFLALVSSHFLASDFCIREELPKALDRERAGQLRVIPVLVAPCDWKTDGTLKDLQFLNGAEPIPRSGEARDKVLARIAGEFKDVVEEIRVKLGTSRDPALKGSGRPGSSAVSLPAPKAEIRLNPDTFKADLQLAQAAVDAFGKCFRSVSGLRSRGMDPKDYVEQMADGRHREAIDAFMAIGVHHEPALKEVCDELLLLLAQIRGQVQAYMQFLRSESHDPELVIQTYESAFEFLPRGFVETYAELQAAVRATRAGGRWTRPYLPYLERMKAKGFDFFAKLPRLDGPEARKALGPDLKFE